MFFLSESKQISNVTNTFNESLVCILRINTSIYNYLNSEYSSDLSFIFFFKIKLMNILDKYLSIQTIYSNHKLIENRCLSIN